MYAVPTTHYGGKRGEIHQYRPVGACHGKPHTRPLKDKTIPYPPRPLVPTAWRKGVKTVSRRGFSPSPFDGEGLGWG